MSSGSDEWRSFKALSVRTAGSFLKKEVRRPAADRQHEESVQRIQEEHNQRVEQENVQALAAATSHYFYGRLQPEEVRLLELLPGAGAELIQCRLLPTSLNQSPGQYEALSYVWGDPSQARATVLVDGTRLEIYETLYQILVQLRLPTDGRMLWVDAICINQSDVEERNMQLPLMQSIYRDALRTVVWLGLESTTTGDTFQMLQELAAEAISLNPQLQQDHHSLSSTKDLTLDENATQRPMLITSPPSFHSYIPFNSNRMPSKARDRWDGDYTIFKVISGGWWQRAWTVQELLLSSNILLLKGPYEIAWTKLCIAVDYGLSLRIWAVVDSGFVLNQAIVPYASIRALDRRLHQQISGDVSPSEIFLSLLMHCRHREARDPRDKIYAVLGMIPGCHSTETKIATGKEIELATADTNDISTLDSITTKPDYGHPVVYIYRQISQQLITQTESLDILGVCPTSHRRALPSWVTDWSINTAIESPLMCDSIDRPRTTHAAKHSRAKPQFPADGITIILHGYELTTIQETSDHLRRIPFDTGEDSPPAPSGEEQVSSLRKEFREAWSDTHQTLSLMAAYFRTIFLWEKFAAARQPTNPSGDISSIYWQTLCTGTYMQGSKSLTEQSYKNWLQTLEPVRKTEKIFKSLASKITPPLYSMNPSSWKGFSEFSRYIEGAHERRLAWAENGWLCLLPQKAQKGDRIILAEGGRVPLVVRPDGDGYYMFVGEAYVQGIMDGEAFIHEKCSEIKIC